MVYKKSPYSIAFFIPHLFTTVGLLRLISASSIMSSCTNVDKCINSAAEASSINLGFFTPISLPYRKIILDLINFPVLLRTYEVISFIASFSDNVILAIFAFTSSKNSVKFCSSILDIFIF